MAISPINVSRVSQNMQAAFALGSMQRNQRELFANEARIATGRDFVTPSEDPIAAARTVDLTQAMHRQEQFLTNLRHADAFLTSADDAVSEVNSLLIEAQTIASKNISNLTSAAERRADAQLIAGIRQQLQAVGNRLFDGRYIFAGRDTSSRPFVEALGGIAYLGDTGELVTRVDDDAQAVINMPGNVLFGALSSQIASGVDLTPALTADTRLDDIRGATGQGIRRGTLMFSEATASVFAVDLESADTIGDIVTLINTAAAEAGSALTASVSQVGVTITPGSSAVAVSDSAGGAVASALGILTSTPTTDAIVGSDLSPRLTRLTPVSMLAGGAGLDLDNGLIITNGPRTATVDLSSAESVQDIINAINNADVFVRARISDDGTRIDVLNEVSGVSLTIGENGGTTAGDLGIRTLSADTPLSQLNRGRGVMLTSDEDDLRVQAKDGAAFDVNLDTAVTVGDVIELMNTAAELAGVAITASLAEVGNGIRLVDRSGGTGEMIISSLNQSGAAADLGIAGTLSGDATELTGGDRNPTRTDGILSALLELEDALTRDDTREITATAARLDPLAREVTRNHGILGARAQAMRSKMERMQDAAGATEIFLSEIRDVDYAEAVTQLQRSTLQLQASMQASSQFMRLSLMDFLR
ncbi:MAG: flagellar hook-associated protein FlgL [Phycisphaerae bacterium]